MVALTRKQRTAIEAALDPLLRARRFLDDPRIAVARKGGPATTTLHYTRADGATLYELDKQFGSDLNGLDAGIAALRAFLSVDTRTADPDTALPAHLEVLLLQAARTAGTLEPDLFLPCIEEQLTQDECDAVRGFLGWLNRNDLRFGHGNLQQRYADFVRSGGT